MDDARQRFERLFKAHEHHVHAYCARRLDAAAVDDAVAETFSVVWEKLDQVPAGTAALPWLYAAAYRVVQHEWRSNGRRIRLRNRSISAWERPGDGVVEEVTEAEDRRLVVEAAGRLPEDDQEILRLTLWEDITPMDAAIVLGISPEASRQRARRARERLRDEFHRLSQQPGPRNASTTRTSP